MMIIKILISNDRLEDKKSFDTGTSRNNMVQMEGSGEREPFSSSGA